MLLESLVQEFYSEIWNRRNLSYLPKICHEDILFRGSIGIEKRGVRGLADYVAYVTASLDEYSCRIRELVVEDQRAFARMLFSGCHVKTFLGHGPTGKIVTWEGAALFKCDAGKIREIWVLGDLKSLERQLESNESLSKKAETHKNLPRSKIHDKLNKKHS